jgi:excisionase family DNA binding protein
LSAICNLVDTYAIHDVQMKRLDELLSAQDLADYLDVPLSTLYDWRWRGEGPKGFRAGKHIRYRRADIEEWIQRQLDSHLSHR